VLLPSSPARPLSPASSPSAALLFPSPLKSLDAPLSEPVLSVELVVVSSASLDLVAPLSLSLPVLPVLPVLSLLSVLSVLSAPLPPRGPRLLWLLPRDPSAPSLLVSA
jgi:hypothetical protein